MARCAVLQHRDGSKQWATWFHLATQVHLLSLCSCNVVPSLSSMCACAYEGAKEQRFTAQTWCSSARQFLSPRLILGNALNSRSSPTAPHTICFRNRAELLQDYRWEQTGTTNGSLHCCCPSAYRVHELVLENPDFGTAFLYNILLSRQSP